MEFILNFAASPFTESPDGAKQGMACGLRPSSIGFALVLIFSLVAYFFLSGRIESCGEETITIVGIDGEQQQAAAPAVKIEPLPNSSIPAVPIEASWGLRRIYDSYQDLVYATIVTNGQFKELRELVGSLHRWRRLGSQQLPLLHVYGWKMQKREVDEISLWRNVVYQDVRQALSPVGIFSGDEALAEGETISTSIDERAIVEERATSKSLKYHLLSRIVQMHGNGIFVKVGHVFEQGEFDKMRGQLKALGYFAGEAAEGSLAIEGFLVDTPAFNCKVKAIWDPFIARSCHNSILKSGPLENFGVASLSWDVEADNLNACHIAIRDDAHHGWAFFKDLRKKPATSKSSRRKVALAFPTTSRGVREFWDLPFLSVFLPSIVKSIGRSDLEGHQLTFYVGFDEGDPIYDDREALKRIVKKTNQEFRSIGAPGVKMVFLRMGISKAVTFIWNALFSLAMSDGQDYFYQLNDDVRFLSKGWLRTFTHALEAQEDFGVVGPHDEAFKCRILTQSMVGRTHWLAFGWYFPPEFRNWQCDTWISLVYAGWMKCFWKMEIFNGRYGKNGQLPRYQACRQTQFRPLTLYYQTQRLKDATGRINPKLIERGEAVTMAQTA